MPDLDPYLEELVDLRVRWARRDLDGLPEAIADALGQHHATEGGDYDIDELAATRAADALIRHVLRDWVILRRPATLGALADAPDLVRDAVAAVDALEGACRA